MATSGNAKPKGAGKPQAGQGRKGQAEAAKAKAAYALSDGREVKHATPRLKKLYRDELVGALAGEGGNPMAVARLGKIVINIGVSDAKDNIQMLDQSREELALISGQAPQVRRAKKSISNFKLRMGVPIGLRVTMRGDRMYEFLDRLISIAIPRIRDFRGLDPKGFDGNGNYNLGLREQLIFPEVFSDVVTRQRGMNISFVTDAGSDAGARELLRGFGMPFRKEAGTLPVGKGGDTPAPETPGAGRAGE